MQRVPSDQRFAELSTLAEWEAAWVLLKISYPELDFADMAATHEMLRGNGYRIFGLISHNKLVAVAGVVVEPHPHFGHELVVKDLITMPDERGRGHARVLLQQLERFSLEKKYRRVVLHAPADATAAVEFGEQQPGFARSTIVFAKELSSTLEPRRKTAEVVVIIVRNSKGEFLVHQRRADKQSYPSLLGLGAGGRVAEGETAAQAAQRELLEETHIATQPIPLFQFPFLDRTQRHLVHVFEVTFDGPVPTCPREWSHSAWHKEAAVIKLLEENKLCPDTAVLFRIWQNRSA